MLNHGSAPSTPTEAEKDACSLTGSVSQDWQRQRSQSDERPEKKGTLLKWTNYIQGWQQRYIVLSNGTVSYYKSEFDTTFGCRGSMSLLMATVQPHEFDGLRFDVSVTDCIYYLRCESAAERQEWLTALRQAKERVQQDHGYGSDVQSIHSPIASLARGNSLLSLTSVLSNSSSTSKPSRSARLKEKLLEMETFRDLLQHQMDNLQQVFDQCLESVPTGSESGADLDAGQSPKAVCNHLEDDDEEDDEEDGEFVSDENQAMIKSKPSSTAGRRSLSGRSPRPAVTSSVGQCTNYDHRCCDISRRLTQQSSDLRSELITFRATMTGVLSTLSMCSDLFQRKDDRMQRMLEHERDRRQRLEKALHDCQDKLRDANEKWQRQAAKAGPDFQEGPHSMMREDEFLDAFEGELERLEQEDAQRTNSFGSKESDSDADSTQFHAYQEMVEEKLEENVRYGYEEVSNLWSVAFEDGDLKVYRRDLEEGGVVVDPLKAYHCVPGITAYELCSAFFDDSCRMEWETTIESLDVLDRYGNDTLVAHQVLKRVWPSTQREIVFLSVLRELPPRGPDEHGFGYVVCNFSVEHPSAPVSGKCVRAHINVAMLAHTYVTGVEDGAPIERSNLMCKITYSANVNPGGWAPPSVVRAISKREYPKFLRRFSSYATSKLEGQPIQFEPLAGCTLGLA